jgi:AcrR family transcriptional regulator
MTDTKSPGRAVGRPRNANHDRTIMVAVMAELAERPYSKLTVDDVAKRAGVAKTTLYRRYPTKLALVAAGVEQYFATRFFALRGHTIDDVIINALEQMIYEYEHTSGGRALAHLASESLGDPELHALMRRTSKRSELRQAVLDAVERRELRSDTDVEVVVDVLVSTFVYRIMVLHEPTPPDFATRLARLVLEGCRTHKTNH